MSDYKWSEKTTITSTTPTTKLCIIDGSTPENKLISPTYFALSSHTHPYLSLSGGSLSGSLTTNNQFISTISGATAPLSVQSSALVVNLNADLLDGQHGTYYQAASTAINTTNIASQSVGYATNAGNADTLDSKHASSFQLASTAINTSNIGSQSVNFASNAGNADTLDTRHASYFQPLLTNPVTGTGSTNQMTYWSGTTINGANVYWNPVNGRMGVGTATPNEKLEVIGNVRTSGTFSVYDTTNVINRFNINSNGNTTIGDATNISEPLTVRGNIESQGPSQVFGLDDKTVLTPNGLNSAYTLGISTIVFGGVEFSDSASLWSENKVVIATDGVDRITVWQSGDTSINGYLLPQTTDTYSIGSSAFKWTEIWATNGTIQTSDAREKTEVINFTENELKAARELSKEIGTYKFLSDIQKNGSGAKTHIGMTVQRAIEIMQLNNLNPFDYSFICYDKWDGGDTYGFRYDELIAFIARGFEERLRYLENKL